VPTLPVRFNIILPHTLTGGETVDKGTTKRTGQPESEGWNPGALTGCGTPAPYTTETSSTFRRG
jgi:hypothetical protein